MVLKNLRSSNREPGLHKYPEVQNDYCLDSLDAHLHEASESGKLASSWKALYAGQSGV